MAASRSGRAYAVLRLARRDCTCPLASATQVYSACAAFSRIIMHVPFAACRCICFIRTLCARRHDDAVHNGVDTAFIGSRDGNLDRKQRPCHWCHKPSVLQRNPCVDMVGRSAAHNGRHAVSQHSQCTRKAAPVMLTSYTQSSCKRPQKPMIACLQALHSLGRPKAYLDASSQAPMVPVRPAQYRPVPCEATMCCTAMPAGRTVHSRPWELNENRICYLMTVAYDGTDFHGYQVQVGTQGVRTVAGELMRMLCIIFQVEPASLSMNVRTRLSVPSSLIEAPTDVPSMRAAPQLWTLNAFNL